MAVITRDSASVSEAPSRDWASVLSSPWMLAVILFLAFAVYVPALDDWFATDDFWFLRGAQSNTLADYTLTSFDPRETQLDYEFNRYRPLYPIAWKLQYEVFGLNALPYHAVVVALHLACVVLAWFVFRRLLGEGGFANLATAIFALHPAYVDAVGWVSAGNRVFAALPYIAALLLFMKSRDQSPSNTSQQSQTTSRLCYAGSVLMFVTALLMHSSTVTLVGVLVVYVFCVDGQPKDALRLRAWWPLVPFVVPAASAMLVQFYVRDHIAVEGFHFGFHMFANYGWYFGMMVVPVETLTSRDALQSFAERIQLIAALVLIVVACGIAYRRPFWGLGVFAVSWFLLALLPDATFVLGQQGRLLYIAGFAGALLLVTAVLFVRDLLPLELRARIAPIAPWIVVAAIVPVALYTAERASNLRHNTRPFERYAITLQNDGPEIGDGGTLYLVGSPARGGLSPDSHLITLAQLYYGDVNVVVVQSGQTAPVLQSGDAVFTYTP